jgi:phage protein D
MSNKLALGLVIGGAVSSTVGAAFKDVTSRIKKLEETGKKARVLEKTIGDTMRLRDEWLKAHRAGEKGADELRKKLENNLAALKKQGVEVRNLGKAYTQMGKTARAAELKAKGHAQLDAGKQQMKSSIGQATAASAAMIIPAKISADYGAIIRDIAIKANIANTPEEATLSKTVIDTSRDTGKASDMRGSGKTTRSGSWEDVPLSKIVADVAARNGWAPVCPVNTKVARADQLNESDFNFITRLAKQYDCTAKVADDKLLVMPRQGGQSASGKALAPIVITLRDVSRWQFHFGDRDSHKVVGAKHQDKKTGKLAVVSLENDDAPAGLPAVHTDRHIHPNKTAAEAAAKARLAAFNRSTAGVRLEMPGRTDLFAERPIIAQGFKVGLDGDYLAESVEQTYTQAGWSTTVECNGGKNGKANAKGKKKKKEAKPVKVVNLK